MTGRVALVTGAGRGIGRATALALAARGVRVMATARSRHELEQLGLEFVVESLETPEGCARVVDETRRRLGPIQILVNNAGIGTADERVVWEQEPVVWRQTMAINLDGPFQLCRLTVGDMVERGWGRVVMVSSTAGQVAGPSMSAYVSSKHGLLGLMRSVAQDAGPYGVTCNAVLPGWVRTEMAERSAAAEAARRGITVERVWEERAAEYPAGRVVEPHEVAEAIAFLASEQASGVNGEAVRVSLGGLW